MPQVLEREKTTLESTVEAPERREFREPQPPPRKEIGPVRWIAWVVALMAVALAGVFVFDMVVDGGDGTIASDGSFEANELARMQTLAPQAITSDGSYDANELARMQTLAPQAITSDGSYDANELARMQTLAPQAITSDGSYDAKELARMLTFAPELDDSFEVNEMARFMRLAPQE